MTKINFKDCQYLNKDIKKFYELLVHFILIENSPLRDALKNINYFIPFWLK